MKKIIIVLLISILLIGCKGEPQKAHLKGEVKHLVVKKNNKEYYIGQKVYLKPDSLTVTISNINDTDEHGNYVVTYDVKYIIAGDIGEATYILPENFFGYEN